MDYRQLRHHAFRCHHADHRRDGHAECEGRVGGILGDDPHGICLLQQSHQYGFPPPCAELYGRQTDHPGRGPAAGEMRTDQCQQRPHAEQTTVRSPRRPCPLAEPAYPSGQGGDHQRTDTGHIRTLGSQRRIHREGKRPYSQGR